MSNLTIYFKSGNKVTIDKVTSWSVSSRGEEITGVVIGQRKLGFLGCKRRLVVQSLDLRAIECIIEH